MVEDLSYISRQNSHQGGCMTATLEAQPINRSGNKLEAKHIKKVFTTGEAAALCGVSQQTIIRSFDSGQLQGFRVPGSKFRKIPRDNLIRFMKENGVPLNDLLQTPEDEMDPFGQKRWEHRSRNGTVFTTECRDFSTEIFAQIPESLSEGRFAEDVAEMIDRHLTTIHPLLTNFVGYGTLVYRTLRV